MKNTFLRALCFIGSILLVLQLQACGQEKQQAKPIVADASSQQAVTKAPAVKTSAAAVPAAEAATGNVASEAPAVEAPVAAPSAAEAAVAGKKVSESPVVEATAAEAQAAEFTAAETSAPVVSEPPTPAVPVAEDFAGEFSKLSARVPLTNYYFIKGAVSVFGTRWGASPTTPQELEDAVWDQLVLSYEAFRRGIETKEEELNAEIKKVLESEKVTFDWQQDKEAYSKWAKEKLNISVETFQNFLRHLLQLENLRKEMLDSFKPAATEEEARAEFINEHNTIELELAQFDELQDAQDYYKKMQDPKLWEEQNTKDPKYYKHPGFVSFEFLIFMWKIPKDDLYKMIKMEDNSIYPPAPIYKGYGVFRILKRRPAVEEDFPKYKDSYMKQVEMNKKYEMLKEWQKKLKDDAGIIVYPRGDVQGAQ
ncbi:MAG: hypothetical protein WC547_08795 [Candidatus Omnitrophota bacterium]